MTKRAELGGNSLMFYLDGRIGSVHSGGTYTMGVGCNAGQIRALLHAVEANNSRRLQALKIWENTSETQKQKQLSWMQFLG